MSLLYRDGSNLVLMDDETFDQLEVADSIVDAGSRRFLVDGMKLEVRARLLLRKDLTVAALKSGQLYL
jgi:translation elongation factor P/translation initiation factor 5A